MRLGTREKLALAYISDRGGKISAGLLDTLVAPRTIRSLFSKGLIAGDAIPVQEVTLTAAGLTALARVVGDER